MDLVKLAASVMPFECTFNGGSFLHFVALVDGGRHVGRCKNASCGIVVIGGCTAKDFFCPLIVNDGMCEDFASKCRRELLPTKIVAQQFRVLLHDTPLLVVIHCCYDFRSITGKLRLHTGECIAQLVSLGTCDAHVPRVSKYVPCFSSQCTVIAVNKSIVSVVIVPLLDSIDGISLIDCLGAYASQSIVVFDRGYNVLSLVIQHREFDDIIIIIRLCLDIYGCQGAK